MSKCLSSTDSALDDPETIVPVVDVLASVSPAVGANLPGPSTLTSRGTTFGPSVAGANVRLSSTLASGVSLNRVSNEGISTS